MRDRRLPGTLALAVPAREDGVMNPVVVVVAVLLAAAGILLLVRARAIAEFMRREHSDEPGNLGTGALSPQSPTLYRLLGVIAAVFGVVALVVPVPV